MRPRRILQRHFGTDHRAERAALEADVRAGEWRDPKGAWRVFNLELWLGSFARDRVAAAAAG